jgi:hypothetical protein
MLNYKPVKNRDKPGRPPSGCIWAKDEEGKKIFNEQGELAYREATPEEIAAKAAEKAAKAIKKDKKTAAKRGRKPAPQLPEDAQAALTLKRTYTVLSYVELEKVGSIVSGLMAKRKELERARLEKELSDIQAKLGSL